MNELATLMREVLGTSFMMYYKAQVYHWNVEGILFKQFHDFFGEIYSEVYGSIDGTAEEIRALGEYPSTGLTDIISSSRLSSTNLETTNPIEMCKDLLVANGFVLNTLNDAFAKANETNQQGLADYLAGRIDSHKKHEWMLRSTLKGSE